MGLEPGRMPLIRGEILFAAVAAGSADAGGMGAGAGTAMPAAASAGGDETGGLGNSLVFDTKSLNFMRQCLPFTSTEDGVDDVFSVDKVRIPSVDPLAKPGLNPSGCQAPSFVILLAAVVPWTFLN